MDYQEELDLCEYNPMSVQYHEEIRALAALIEKPAMSFLEKLIKQIVLTHKAKA